MSYDWDSEETDLREPQDEIKRENLPREYYGGETEHTISEQMERLLESLKEDQQHDKQMGRFDESKESQVEQIKDLNWEGSGESQNGDGQEQSQKGKSQGQGTEKSESGTDKTDSDDESSGDEDKSKHLTISIQCGYCGEILGIKKHLEENPEHYIMVEMVQEEENGA